MIKCTILALAVGAAVPAGAQTCLHGDGESASARRRRLEAVRYIQDVHAAQTRLARERGTFVPLGEAVPASAVPLGFVPRLTYDRFGYAILVRDALDPCGFTLFSDQDGVIYEGRPARTSEEAPASRD